MPIVERHVPINSNNSMGLAAGVFALALSMTFAASPANAQTTTPVAEPPTATAVPPAASGDTALPRVNVVGAKPAEKPIPGGSAMPIRDAVVNAYLKIHREPIKEPVTQTGCKPAMAAGKPYFVEFRSRGAQSYGHTFVFYGRLGAGQQVRKLQRRRAASEAARKPDLYPRSLGAGAGGNRRELGRPRRAISHRALLRDADRAGIQEGRRLHQKFAGDQEDLARGDL